MPTLPPSQTTPPIDPLLVRLAEPISRYLESERLQRRLLGDCSYSPSDYQLDHWSAWEAGGCYTLAAALRPLLAPAGLLAGVYVTTDPSDAVGYLEHAGIAIAGGFLDARGLRSSEELIDEWVEITAAESSAIRIAPISPAEERERYRDLIGSEPARVIALQRLLARDLAEPLRALRSKREGAGRAARS